MVGAVFAVGVLFSVVGAGVVLAGMLYQGAPWGTEETPVAQEESPAPVIEPPMPTPVPTPVQVAEVEPVAPIPLAVDPVEAPLPEPAPEPIPESPEVAPAAPTKPSRFPVDLEVKGAKGDVRAVRDDNDQVLLEHTPGKARMATGRYRIRYEQKGMAPLYMDCMVSEPGVECTTDQVFVPLETGERKIKTIVIPFNDAVEKAWVDDREVTLWDGSLSFSVGIHDCKVQPTDHNIPIYTYKCEIEPGGLDPNGQEKPFQLRLKPPQAP